MPSNTLQPVCLSDGAAGLGATEINTGSTYTVTANDNFVICGEDSTAITLNAASNSPVYVTTIEVTTAHTGCTITNGTTTWVIADSGCAAECVKFQGGNEWIVVGAKTAS